MTSIEINNLVSVAAGTLVFFGFLIQVAIYYVKTGCLVNKKTQAYKYDGEEGVIVGKLFIAPFITFFIFNILGSWFFVNEFNFVKICVTVFFLVVVLVVFLAWHYRKQYAFIEKLKGE